MKRVLSGYVSIILLLLSYNSVAHFVASDFQELGWQPKMHSADISAPEHYRLNERRQLKYSALSYTGYSGDFTLYADGKKVLVNENHGNSDRFAYSPYGGEGSYPGLFKFLAEHQSDNLTMKDVDVRIIPPGSLILFLSAIAGLGLVARRRQQVAV